MRGRNSSNVARSTAPSAAERACASDTALRDASAPLRIENANEPPMTVSSTVIHSTNSSAYRIPNMTIDPSTCPLVTDSDTASAVRRPPTTWPSTTVGYRIHGCRPTSAATQPA